MIAKFNTGDGWAYHECDTVLTHQDGVNPTDIGEGFFQYGTHTDEKGLFKKAVVTLRDRADIILYAYDAYLINEGGNTINPL